MRWTKLLAAAVVLLGTIECQGETPDFSGNQPQAMSLLQRGRLLTGAGWWNRYGEPVNAVALANAGTATVDKYGPTGNVPLHGDGYIYGPGACDCSPPCIWDLWSGYYQNPKRCHAHLLHKHCGCGNCAGNCGKACAVSCTTKAPSCGAPVSCTAAVPDCGCKPVCGKCRHFHVGDRWRGFTAHWHRNCDSCSASLGCGCATPAAAAPLGSEKQASQGPPLPLPEEAVLFSLPRLN